MILKILIYLKINMILKKKRNYGKFGSGAFIKFDLNKISQDLKQPETQIKHNGLEVTIQDIVNSFNPHLNNVKEK